MSRGGWVALPRDAIGLSAVCDSDISWSYSLTIFGSLVHIQGKTNLETAGHALLDKNRLFRYHIKNIYKRCNNAPRCKLSSAHKQQSTFEYVFHVVLGDPPLKRVVLTYLVKIWYYKALQRWFCICSICSRAIGLLHWNKLYLILSYLIC